MPSDKHYKAFISYSHRDAKWAKWLHRSLERYVVPLDAYPPEEQLEADGSKRNRRLTPVFRDRDEMPASGSLDAAIQEALESSENLIVLCSPNSAGSQYVNTEIDIFRNLHPDNERKIYALIIEGEPSDCFPPALIEGGAEPIAADAREAGDGKSDAKLKLIAGMLGVGFDRLKQREATRQRNRLLTMVTVVSAVAVMTSVLALWALKAERETGEALSREAAQRELAEEQRELAVQRQKEAEESARESKVVLEFFNQNLLGSLKPKTGLGSGGLGLNVTLAEAVEAAEKKIKNSFTDQPLVEASIRTSLGRAYQLMGNKDNEVILQWKRALELNKQELGPEHPNTLVSMGLLVGGYRGMQRTAEELPLNEEMVRIKKKNLGPEHSSTLWSLGKLGQSYLRLDRINDAIILLEEVFRLQKKTLSPEHLQTIESMLSLTDAYISAGRYKEAQVTGEECLRLQIKAHGFDSDKVSIRYILAKCYIRLGRHQDGINLQKDALRAREGVWGPGHPLTLSHQRDLAHLYESAERQEEALTLRKNIVQVWDKTYGPEANGSITALRELAWAHQEMGQPEEAEQQFRKALLAQKNNDPSHCLYFVTQKGLGTVLAQQKKYPEAETLLLSAHEGLNTPFQKDDAQFKELIECLDEIVRLYEDWNKLDKAAEWQAKLDALEESKK